MKKTALLLILALGIVYLAQGQNANVIPDPPPLGTLPDPTPGIALVSAVNDAIAKAAAWTVWANDAIKTLGFHVTAHEADLANLNSQVTVIAPQVHSLQSFVTQLASQATIFTPVSIPAGFVYQLDAYRSLQGFYFAGATLPSAIDDKRLTGGVYGTAIKFGGTFGNVGTRLRYQFNLDQTGNYIPGYHGAVSSCDSHSLVFHYEIDGVSTPQFVYPASGTNPTLFEAPEMALTAGPHTVYVVVDSEAPGCNGVYIFYWLRFKKV